MNLVHSLAVRGYAPIPCPVSNHDLRDQFARFREFERRLIDDATLSMHVRLRELRYLERFDLSTVNGVRPGFFMSFNNAEIPPNHASFQFSKRYYDFMAESACEDGGDALRWFLHGFLRPQLDYLTAITASFQAIIDQLAHEFPNARSVFLDRDGSLPILLKTWHYRYNGSNWTARPHVDRAGLTIMLGGDAAGDHEEFLVAAPHHEDLDIAQWQSVFGPPDWGPDHCIVIAGSLLSRHGIALAAAPHCVPPLRRAERFSMVAFLAIPYSDLRSVDGSLTDAIGAVVYTS